MLQDKFNYNVNGQAKYGRDDFGTETMTKAELLNDCVAWVEQTNPEDELWSLYTFDEAYKIELDISVQIRAIKGLSIHDELLDIVIVLEMVCHAII